MSSLRDTHRNGHCGSDRWSAKILFQFPAGDECEQHPAASIHLGQTDEIQVDPRSAWEQPVLTAKQAAIHTVVLSGHSAGDNWPAAIPPQGIRVQASVDACV